MQNPLGSPHFKGLPMLWRGLHTVSDVTDRESFYWNYFYPLLSQIMDKTYKEKLKD